MISAKKEDHQRHEKLHNKGGARRTRPPRPASHIRLSRRHKASPKGHSRSKTNPKPNTLIK